MNSVLIIDKPAGLTSHDVVNRARRILKQRSIGHLGTLDPMATGVLPLVTGSFTRLAQFYTGAEKTYEGTIRFGFSTDTYDAEGEPTSELCAVSLNAEAIEPLAARFRGVIQQTPPPFSAKKIKGVPAYKLARKQKPVVLDPVEVEIKEFSILSVESDRIRFRAHVTSGTFMRSVAHDMGQALGCGAHLESLRRTAVAEFTLGDAHTLDELAAAAGNWPPREKSPAYALATHGSVDVEVNVEEKTVSVGGITIVSHNDPMSIESRAVGTPEFIKAFSMHPRTLLPQFPCVTADEATCARIRAGRTINLLELSRARQVKVFASQRDLIAIATRVAGTLFHPKIVFVTDPAPAEASHLSC